MGRRCKNPEHCGFARPRVTCHDHGSGIRRIIKRLGDINQGSMTADKAKSRDELTAISSARRCCVQPCLPTTLLLNKVELD